MKRIFYTISFPLVAIAFVSLSATASAQDKNPGKSCSPMARRAGSIPCHCLRMVQKLQTQRIEECNKKSKPGTNENKECQKNAEGETNCCKLMAHFNACETYCHEKDCYCCDHNCHNESPHSTAESAYPNTAIDKPKDLLALIGTMLKRFAIV